jgi:UPF0716 protein FxsA
MEICDIVKRRGYPLLFFNTQVVIIDISGRGNLAMFKILLAFIIIVPALEIGLLILSGKTLGTIPTILLIISTGVLGAWLAKKQGLHAIQQVQYQIQRGQVPGEVIIDGLCILVGGVLLLTPGFITDAIGFILLFAQTRRMVKPFILNLIRSMINRNTITIIRK